MGSKALLTDEQIEALRELISATIAATTADERAKRALVAAHGLGCSWDDLGAAVGVSRHTVRGRVTAAKKYLAEHSTAVTDTPPQPPEAPEQTAVIVSGPLPAGVH